MPSKWEIIAERKRQKKVDQSLGLGDPELKWMKCEFCRRPICVNNYGDRKVRVQRFRGHLICPMCKSFVLKVLPRLVKFKIVKMRKPKETR